MATIRLRDVTKRFGPLVAVDRASLDVEAGEVLCLLGPSGCGKTTTLRMIAGLEEASEGDVLIAERRVNHLRPSQRDIAMVFQFYALYPVLTVAENLAYPLHSERLPKAEIEARVRRVAELLHLEPVLGRTPGQLAEGEKQRAAVGRAIIRDPQCFLFDEPLSRLDVEQRQTMRGQIKELLAGLSKATVIVTHDQLEALTMADRIAVMREGTIEQIDTPHRIFTEPANLFVAGFIGTPRMNLIEATLTGAAGVAEAVGQGNGEGKREGIGLEFGGQTVRLPLPRPDGTPDGSRITLGIRPRACVIAGEAADDTITGLIDLVEPMGAETLVHLLHGEQDLRVVVDRETRVTVGERTHFRLLPESVHLFDGDGRRIEPPPGWGQGQGQGQRQGQARG